MLTNEKGNKILLAIIIIIIVLLIACGITSYYAYSAEKDSSLKSGLTILAVILGVVAGVGGPIALVITRSNTHFTTKTAITIDESQYKKLY